MRLFFSHSWKDTAHVQTHALVVRIARFMRSRGYDVWLDEMCMRHDVDMSMLQGIQSCSVFVCFVTAPYIDSVQKLRVGTGKEQLFQGMDLACQREK